MSKHPIENPPSYDEAMGQSIHQATGMHTQTFTTPTSIPNFDASTSVYPIQTAPPPGMSIPQQIPQYQGQMQMPGGSAYPNIPSAPPEPPKLMPTYGSIDTHTTTVITTEPRIIVVGGCPSCRIGVLDDDYTCCGICCAICFFPIGILCCLAMKQKRCTNCGAEF